MRWFGHTSDGSVPAVDETLQVRYSIAYLYHIEEIFNPVKATRFFRGLEIVIEHEKNHPSSNLDA